MLLRNGIAAAFISLLSFSSIIFIIHLYRRHNSPSSPWPSIVPSTSSKSTHYYVPCPDRLSWLDHLDLTYPLKYAQRDIIIKPSASSKRDLITRIDEPLFPGSQTIDRTDGSQITLNQCWEPLVLNVPIPAKGPVNASNLIFGISTSLQRLDDSIPALMRWLAHSRAKLFAIVIESDNVIQADAQNVAKLQSKMRGLGLDATLVPPHDGYSFSERYFSLVELMYTNRNSETQWVSLVDDDTFFPSMQSLLDMLSKHDPSEQQYVGALSEDWWSVTHYGLMGFGGAGIFLSLPLAEVVNNKSTECRESTSTTAGDIRIKECIYSQTNTKLTHVPQLHQLDLADDYSGFFESGRLFLSVHHWKGGGWDGSGYHIATMHLVADICGDCFLQRWQFSKDTVLSNGFSISTYPKGDLSMAKGGIDMDKMERTWGPSAPVENSINSGNDHSLGPTRRKMALEKEKIQYHLLDSEANHNGVRQTYFHKGINGDLDAILELFWRRENATRV